MSTKRETMFLCSHASAGRRITAWVVAWDADGARRQFRREQGLGSRAAVEVVRPHREMPQVPGFEPLAAG
jgi:hypothetical protein